MWLHDNLYFYLVVNRLTLKVCSMKHILFILWTTEKEMTQSWDTDVYI